MLVLANFSQFLREKIDFSFFSPLFLPQNLPFFPYFPIQTAGSHMGGDFLELDCFPFAPGSHGVPETLPKVGVGPHDFISVHNLAMAVRALFAQPTPAREDVADNVSISRVAKATIARLEQVDNRVYSWMANSRGKSVAMGACWFQPKPPVFD